MCTSTCFIALWHRKLAMYSMNNKAYIFPTEPLWQDTTFNLVNYKKCEKNVSTYNEKDQVTRSEGMQSLQRKQENRHRECPHDEENWRSRRGKHLGKPEVHAHLPMWFVIALIPEGYCSLKNKKIYCMKQAYKWSQDCSNLNIHLVTINPHHSTP